MTSPLPRALVLLALALPGIVLAGRCLARWTGLDRSAVAVIGPGLGLALWMLATHVAGLLSRSFVIGLCAGTLSVGVAGYVVWWLQRRRRRRRGGGAALPRALWAAAALATAAFAPAVLCWAIHDELGFGDHMSTAAQLQNGIYPPRYPSFPEVLLRYHYGFDLLVAAVSALTRLRLDIALDVVTLIAWAYAFCVLWLLGERWVGRDGGWLAAPLVLLGGGLTFVCNGLPHSLADTVGRCDVEGVYVNPPLPSYFLQRPFSLGVPLGACALLVATARTRSPARYLVIATLLLSLWLSHVVFFVTLAGAIAFADVFADSAVTRRGGQLSFTAAASWRRAAAWAVTLTAVALATRALGGFAVPRADDTGPDLVVHLGVTHTVAGTLRWLLVSLGAVALIGVPGLVFLRRGKLLAAVLAAGSIAVVLTLQHPHTWDVVKFAVVAGIPLCIAGAAAVRRAAQTRPRMVGVPAAVAAGAAMVASGALFLAALAFDSDRLSSRWPRAAPRLLADDEAAVAWLRPRVPAGELVYRSLPAAHGYAIWGGLPQVWLSRYTASFGFDDARVTEREKLVTELPSSADDYLRHGIVWFVLGPGDDRLAAHAAVWRGEGRVRDRTRFGALEVIELERGRR